ncbi:MAG: GNAT family N-acetyltransferase [Rhodoglobus sp.]|nr:GNAT family N-acetyltransferase [Rhodoglobus sp.]
MTVAIEPARQPDVERLLALGEVFARSLYPPDECFLLDIAELDRPGVTVLVARVESDAMGMVAVVGPDTSDGGDGSAEIKRLFIEDRARGRGLARELIAAVEQFARDNGATVIRLETGPRSDAALALYRSSGYRDIPLFGQYIGSASSVCMEKVL